MDQSKRNWRASLAVPLFLALLKLGLHFYYSNYYGYQRDELYFIACGERLALGYVDVGPLVPWIGRFMREVLGESLFALRLPSAIAGAGTVFLTAWLAGFFGGGLMAQWIAGIGVIIAPVWLQSGNILALPSFEPVLWMGAICLIASIIKKRDNRLWLAVGVVAGVGLLNKPSMAFFGVGLLVGLLLTEHRRHLADWRLWAGGALALLIVLPNLHWQAAHGWPTWEFLRGMNRDLMSRIPRWLFLAGQVFYQHPLNVPIWLAGLAWLLFAERGKPYRMFAWMFLTVLALLFIAKSKIYYLAPAFPVLFAAGGAALAFGMRGRVGRSLPALCVALLVLGGTATAPIGLPVLPLEKVDAYVGRITFGILDKIYEVTGTWHDQFGWENQVAVAASVYDSLSAEEQADCRMIVGNFGQAGALDFWGPAYGLSRPTCAHQNYFFWGPGPGSGNIAIMYGIKEEMVSFLYEDVRPAAVISCPESLPFEDGLTVYVCRNPRIDLDKAWPALRIIAFSNVGITPRMGLRLRESIERIEGKTL